MIRGRRGKWGGLSAALVRCRSIFLMPTPFRHSGGFFLGLLLVGCGEGVDAKEMMARAGSSASAALEAADEGLGEFATSAKGSAQEWSDHAANAALAFPQLARDTISLCKELDTIAAQQLQSTGLSESRSLVAVELAKDIIPLVRPLERYARARKLYATAQGSAGELVNEPMINEARRQAILAIGESGYDIANLVSAGAVGIGSSMITSQAKSALSGGSQEVLLTLFNVAGEIDGYRGGAESDSILSRVLDAILRIPYACVVVDNLLLVDFSSIVDPKGESPLQR